MHAVIIHVVNVDALAQANDFRIKRRQVVFLCWMQDSNPEGLWNRISSRLNARWQTDWAIEDQALKLELYSLSLWSASIQPTQPHCHLALGDNLLSEPMLTHPIHWRMYATPGGDELKTWLSETMVRHAIIFISILWVWVSAHCKWLSNLYNLSDHTLLEGVQFGHEENMEDRNFRHVLNFFWICPFLLKISQIIIKICLWKLFYALS